ncbi:citramalate synthase [Christensenellaceae bacterium 44-20]
MKLEILDSTLRDGAQGADISFSLSDKLAVARQLAKLGIPLIEAGNPGSNPKDAEFFAEAQKLALGGSALVAFGSTRRKHTRAQEDAALAALLSAGTAAVCIFGKASALHVAHVLETSPEENLAMIADSVGFAHQAGRRVIFDAEHFFDGFAENPDYALRVLSAAAEAGADTLCLCDTNGGTFPEQIGEITALVCQKFPGHKIGIHCHNDSGLAVAGTMQAVFAGAAHVQGTLLGFGERCGNANLSTILPNLQLKAGYACIPPEQMERLTSVCRALADTANLSLPGSLPYVGSAAFAHKAGMHVDAVNKLHASFEHISPGAVGNKRRRLVGEVSGKSSLLRLVRRYQPEISKNSPKLAEIMDQLKRMEFAGYQFEAAEESLDLLIRRCLHLQEKFFTLDHYKIIGEYPLFAQLSPSSAIVKVRVGQESSLTSAEGNGPVHALDLALRRALIPFYPCLADMRLADYKVRVLESDATTAAGVRVLIESTDGQRTWRTVGVSSDILEASFLALSDSIEYKLTLEKEKI